MKSAITRILLFAMFASASVPSLSVGVDETPLHATPPLDSGKRKTSSEHNNPAPRFWLITSKNNPTSTLVEVKRFHFPLKTWPNPKSPVPAQSPVVTDPEQLYLTVVSVMHVFGADSETPLSQVGAIRVPNSGVVFRSLVTTTDGKVIEDDSNQRGWIIRQRLPEHSEYWRALLAIEGPTIYIKNGEPIRDHKGRERKFSLDVSTTLESIEFPSEAKIAEIFKKLEEKESAAAQAQKEIQERVRQDEEREAPKRLAAAEQARRLREERIAALASIAKGTEDSCESVDNDKAFVRDDMAVICQVMNISTTIGWLKTQGWLVTNVSTQKAEGYRAGILATGGFIYKHFISVKKVR